MSEWPAFDQQLFISYAVIYLFIFTVAFNWIDL